MIGAFRLSKRLYPICGFRDTIEILHLATAVAEKTPGSLIQAAQYLIKYPDLEPLLWTMAQDAGKASLP